MTYDHINLSIHKIRAGNYRINWVNKQVAKLVKANGVWVLHHSQVSNLWAGVSAIQFFKTMAAAIHSLRVTLYRAYSASYPSHTPSGFDTFIVEHPIDDEFIVNWANVLGNLKNGYLSSSPDGGYYVENIAKGYYRVQHSDASKEDYETHGSHKDAVDDAACSVYVLWEGRLDDVEYLTVEDHWSLALLICGETMTKYSDLTDSYYPRSDCHS
jgi:hypothetical protein